MTGRAFSRIFPQPPTMTVNRPSAAAAPPLLTGGIEHVDVRTGTGFRHRTDRVGMDGGMDQQVSVTSANINDGKAGPEALPGNPGEVFADSAYRGNHFRDAVRAKGGIPRIVATGVWVPTEEEAQAWLHQWNQPIHRVRGRIENIFGTWKRCYGLRRMRWRGFAKAAVQVQLTAIACNFKRTMNILTAAT